jgi:hypothetical protein
LVGTGCAEDGYSICFCKIRRSAPVEIAVLTDAYERTLQKLSLVDRNDPRTELIAKKVIELGQRGVRDAGQLSELTIKELGFD